MCNEDPSRKNDENGIINNEGDLGDEFNIPQKKEHEKLSYKAVVLEDSTTICLPSACFNGSFCRPECMDTETTVRGFAANGDRRELEDDRAANDPGGGGNEGDANERFHVSEDELIDVSEQQLATICVVCKEHVGGSNPAPWRGITRADKAP
ncbi:hypothetical protein SUGI_0246780 [Cryptomeria japonica]|nr:hypothetical protein SUGI_0246780 [Cryptomeria japonica]